MIWNVPNPSRFRLIFDRDLVNKRQQVALMSYGLIRSIEKKDFQFADYFISRGADINVDHAGWTALHYASSLRQDGLKICKMLISHKADIHATTGSKETALIIATKQENVALASFLIDHKADVNHEDFYRRSALSYANDPSMTRLLLDRKAVVDLMDIDRRTPLFYAVFYGHEGVVKLLLDASSDIYHRDDDGQTILELLDRRPSCAEYFEKPYGDSLVDTLTLIPPDVIRNYIVNFLL